MTDQWCFTCDHEIREGMRGWVHLHDDDNDNCICVDDGAACEPR